jgi:hypothetical protein
MEVLPFLSDFRQKASAGKVRLQDPIQSFQPLLRWTAVRKYYTLCPGISAVQPQKQHESEETVCFSDIGRDVR